MHIEHFTYGAITPALALALSVLGSLLGLVCTMRAQAVADRTQRAQWLLLAAWAIGGTGMWVMHFMALIGYSVPGLPVRYDMGLTVASWITAMVTAGIGLFIAAYGQPSLAKILAGGVFSGVGVAAMHYSGLAGVKIASTISYEPNLVIASVVIAVVAATAALWLALSVGTGAAIAAASLVMGVGASGMHYTGMFAMTVSGYTGEPIAGQPAMSFLAPIVVFVLAVVVVLLVAFISGSDAGNDAAGVANGAAVNAVAKSAAEPSPDLRARRTSPAAFLSRRP